MNNTISDLFFNFDVSHAEIVIDKKHAGYDDALLRDSAVLLLEMLETLGVKQLPHPDQLVEDYLSRV